MKLGANSVCRKTLIAKAKHIIEFFYHNNFAGPSFFFRDSLFIVETPIPKAKRSGIGKREQSRAAEGLIPRSLLWNLFPKLALGFP